MEDLNTFILNNCNSEEKSIWCALVENTETLHEISNGCFCGKCDMFLFQYDDDDRFEDLNNRFFQCSTCEQYICYPCIKVFLGHVNDEIKCNKCR